MERVSVLVDQLKWSADDAHDLRSTKKELVLQLLRQQFILSDEHLRSMALYMLHEMNRGLSGENQSSLRMLPSFVFKKEPTGTGVVYALDLGGTNFRVIRMKLNGGQLVESASGKFQIPKEHTTGTHEGLFGFIASSVKEFIAKNGYSADNVATTKLGFTFSFPVQQNGIASGTLIKWTKGFTTTGVEGNDVVVLLRDAFAKQGVRLSVVALCNDTVGTLVTRYFSDPTTEMGVILGTGSNACYWERCYNVHKNPEVKKLGAHDVIINMEFGNFDSPGAYVLPVTKYDKIIDAASPNKGAQLFEKMISGYYLGTIASQILVDLSDKSLLPRTFGNALRARPNAFDSAILGRVVTDRTPGLTYIDHVLQSEFKQRLHENERRIVQEVCLLVRHRAAQLSGMAVGASLLKHSRQDNATVAVDGSVFEKTSGFESIMADAIKAVVGPRCSVRLVLTKDGSGLGAGYIAALQ